MNEDQNKSGEKLEGSDIKLAVKSPVLKWLDNFWYHHKWKVIVIAFFAIVITVGAVQMAKKTETDVTVVVAVPEYITPIQSAEIGNVLESVMTSDPNQDGKKEIAVMTYSVYSEEELEEANEEETDDEGRYVIKVERSYNVSQFENYTDYLKTGECTVMLLSNYLYSKLRAEDRLLPLSDIFGDQLPAGALDDGYGISFGDTYFYEFFDSVKILPPDTVVCIMRPYIWGASSDSDRYAAAEDFLRDIACFSE